MNVGAVKTRVMIIDDSGVFRGFWGRLLSGLDDIEVVTTAISGKAAIEALTYHKVDLVLLDVEMPEMDGLQTIPHLFAKQPTLKIIMASGLTTSSSRVTIDALARGAHDFITKPSTLVSGFSVDQVKDELLQKIRALAVKVVEPKVVESSIKTALRSDKTAPPKAILIGSSTGGPNALSVVLSKFDSKITIPIFIVQHMPANFTTMLAERIAKDSERPCREAKDGEIVQPKTIYVAPGGFHMLLSKIGDQVILNLNEEAPENFCRPAVDVLFRSASKVYGSALLGIILTGMGEDGKLGCEYLKNDGATVIAQDEASSVVWGMPGNVVKAGLANFSVPLNNIAEKTSEICVK